MSSFPHKFSVIQHQNLICIFDGCRTLGYQEYRCISGTFFNGSSQSRICCKVQCGSTVIKNQNLRFPDQCPCNGQPLSLSSGKVSSTGLYFSSRPFCFFFTTFSAWAICRAFHSSLSFASFFRHNRLLRIVPRNRTAFCGTTPIFSRRCRKV